MTDQVDSVNVVLNDSGLIVSQVEFLPFGETWTHEGDKGHAAKYNSQELDKETNYYFYNARHYDPEIARFVTADTVIPYENDTQSWNRLSYVRNNPILYKDPTGHEDKDSIGGKQPKKSMGTSATKAAQSQTGSSAQTPSTKPSTDQNPVARALSAVKDSAQKFYDTKKKEWIREIIGNQSIADYARGFKNTSSEGDGRPHPIQPQPSILDRIKGEGYERTTGVEGVSLLGILVGEKTTRMTILDHLVLHTTSVVHDNYVTKNDIKMSDVFTKGDFRFITSMPKCALVALECEKVNESFRGSDMKTYQDQIVAPRRQRERNEEFQNSPTQSFQHSAGPLSTQNIMNFGGGW